MKIDKNNYRHWFYLCRSATYILIALPLRYILPKKNRQSVILYGHKLNGNLKAFYDYYNNQSDEGGVYLYYLTLDPKYYKANYDKQNSKIKSLLHLNRFSDVIKVVRSNAIITDHGMHTLIILNKLTNIPFIDVWHGVPYKGFTEDNFAFFKNYQQLWVTSPAIKKIYISKFKLKPERIFVTGYGRVDKLVTKAYNRNNILRQYKINPKFKKIILMAPTWKQDHRGRSILPFDQIPRQFFSSMNKIARQNKALVIFREHLNSKDGIDISSLTNIKFMPYSEYPVAEEFLFIADILITDWSSIAFDYLPLDRPTIFLDVTAPFKNGFTIGPEHRFGEIVGTMPKLLKSIEEYLEQPDKFKQKYAVKISRTKQLIYGSTLDGKSTARYFDRLHKLLNRNGKPATIAPSKDSYTQAWHETL